MTMQLLTIGFIVNPIAGIGGPAGLKGSDGDKIVQQALAGGYQASAPNQASRFIKKLSQLIDSQHKIRLLTCQGAMGEDIVKHSKLDYELIYSPALLTEFNGQDTRNAYQKICKHHIDIVVFVGGDGTARDILDCQLPSSVPNRPLHLGIAGGVKIQSSVFTLSPAIAAQTVIAFIEGKCEGIYREVLDINEDQLRENIVGTKHYGDLLVPNIIQHLQGAKSRRHISETHKIKTIAHYAYKTMPRDCYIIIGPGSTTMTLKKYMGSGTLLGIDVYRNNELVKKDANRNFLDSISQQYWKLYLTCTGGQGFLLGRGNQQIGPTILKQINQENLTIIASIDKLVELRGQPLRIDCGDDLLEQKITGYYPVLVGNKQHLVYRVSN